MREESRIRTPLKHAMTCVRIKSQWEEPNVTDISIDVHTHAPETNTDAELMALNLHTSLLLTVGLETFYLESKSIQCVLSADPLSRVCLRPKNVTDALSTYINANYIRVSK